MLTGFPLPAFARTGPAGMTEYGQFRIILMDPRLQTSFIPRQAVAGMSISRGGGAQSWSIFSIIALVLFLLSVVAGIATFGYQRFLFSQVEAKNAALVAAQNAFEPETIQGIDRMSRRVDASKTILGTHVMLSPLFDLLEKETLSTVRFASFSFSANSPSDIVLLLNGEAKSFNSVALQSDVFGAEKVIKNPVFSNLDLDASGNVIFRFRASLDPLLVQYKAGPVGGETTSRTVAPASGTPSPLQ